MFRNKKSAPDPLADKMRRDWGRRARENYRHYIVNSQTEWSDEQFWLSGETTVTQYVLNDMGNICQGRRPADMKVLDFGCGAGRVTRALAKAFGAVYGIDISGEMVGLARQALAAASNVHLYQSNGTNLDVLAGELFDFAFAFSVFHHIPTKTAVKDCIAEVGNHLHVGDLFKFEVQGSLTFEAKEDDTWLGTPLSEADILDLADQTGFESRYRVGAGEESYWQWFFKKT
jgi:2-polyprenyl-3-methyl-5-hydroxy-6-metoxy-1,4-benzoquinol methylase